MFVLSDRFSETQRRPAFHFAGFIQKWKINANDFEHRLTSQVVLRYLD